MKKLTLLMILFLILCSFYVFGWQMEFVNTPVSVNPVNCSIDGGLITQIIPDSVTIGSYGFPLSENNYTNLYDDNISSFAVGGNKSDFYWGEAFLNYTSQTLSTPIVSYYNNNTGSWVNVTSINETCTPNYLGEGFVLRVNSYGYEPDWEIDCLNLDHGSSYVDIAGLFNGFPHEIKIYWNTTTQTTMNDIFDNDTNSYCIGTAPTYYYANLTRPSGGSVVAATYWNGTSYENCSLDAYTAACDKDIFEVRFYSDVNVSVYMCRNETTWVTSSNLCGWDFDPDPQREGKIFEFGLYYNVTLPCSELQSNTILTSDVTLNGSCTYSVTNITINPSAVTGFERTMPDSVWDNCNAGAYTDIFDGDTATNCTGQIGGSSSTVLANYTLPPGTTGVTLSYWDSSAWVNKSVNSNCWQDQPIMQLSLYNNPGQPAAMARCWGTYDSPADINNEFELVYAELSAPEGGALWEIKLYIDYDGLTIWGNAATINASTNATLLFNSTGGNYWAINNTFISSTGSWNPAPAIYMGQDDYLILKGHIGGYFSYSGNVDWFLQGNMTLGGTDLDWANRPHLIGNLKITSDVGNAVQLGLLQYTYGLEIDCMRQNEFRWKNDPIGFDGSTTITNCQITQMGSAYINNQFTMVGGTLHPNAGQTITANGSAILNITGVNVTKPLIIDNGATGYLYNNIFNENVTDNSANGATIWCVNSVGNTYISPAVYSGLNDGTCAVFSIDAVSCPATIPVEGSTTYFHIVVNYTASLLTNVSSGEAIVNFSATTSNAGCTLYNDTYAECDVPMQYYDPAGIYTLNVTFIVDGVPEVNVDNTCEYLQLLASDTSSSYVSFDTGTPGDTSVTSDPVVVNNTGNSVFDVFMTSYDLYGDTFTAEVLYASNFYSSLSSDGSNPVAMNNSLLVNTTMQLGLQSSANLYLFVDLPQDLLPQIYYASTPWVLSLQ